MKGKKRLDIAKELEIPKGITGGYFIEIREGKEAVLNGKCDVLMLEDSVLKIKCDEHEITFRGTNLSIDSYTEDEISISGNICTAELG